MPPASPIASTNSGEAFSRTNSDLVLHPKQVAERALANEDSIREDPDPVADFLDLPKQMRGEQDGDSARFQFENQVADFKRAGGIDARCRFIEDEKRRFLDQRLGKPNPLEHSLGITSEPAVPCRVSQADEREQFVNAVPQA